MSPAAVAVHTSYTTADSDGQMWTWMVHQLLGGAGVRVHTRRLTGSYRPVVTRRQERLLALI